MLPALPLPTSWHPHSKVGCECHVSESRGGRKTQNGEGNCNYLIDDNPLPLKLMIWLYKLEVYAKQLRQKKEGNTEFSIFFVVNKLLTSRFLKWTFCNFQLFWNRNLYSAFLEIHILNIKKWVLFGYIWVFLKLFANFKANSAEMAKRFKIFYKCVSQFNFVETTDLDLFAPSRRIYRKT